MGKQKRECDNCDERSAEYRLTIKSLEGRGVNDELLLCEECATDAKWSLNKTGKILECE